MENNEQCTRPPTRVRTRRRLTSSAHSTHRHTSTRSQLIWRRGSARLSRYAGCLHATIAPARRNCPTFGYGAPAGVRFRKRVAGTTVEHSRSSTPRFSPPGQNMMRLLCLGAAMRPFGRRPTFHSTFDGAGRWATRVAQLSEPQRPGYLRRGLGPDSGPAWPFS